MLQSVSYDNASGFGSRVIKRYSNRKLYDTKSSRYVTLLQIAQMVRSGEEVQIIDNRTKEDKTEVTLALIISEELKNSPGGIPLTTLKALIRHDSTPPPSGEQPTFAGARLLGLLGGAEVNGPGGGVAVVPVSVVGVSVPAPGVPSLGRGLGNDDGAVEAQYSFASGSEAFAKKEYSMSDPSRAEGQMTKGERPEGGRPSSGFPSAVERSEWDRSSAEYRAERVQFEQWRNEFEARVNSLPDSQAVVDLQGKVQRLDERVAELEQRLAKREA